MGAGGSAQSKHHTLVLDDKYSPSTPPTSKTTSARLSERSALYSTILSAGPPKKGSTSSSKSGSLTDDERSSQECVHGIIRGQIRDAVVDGESLLKTRPSMTTVERTERGMKRKVSEGEGFLDEGSGERKSENVERREGNVYCY